VVYAARPLYAAGNDREPRLAAYMWMPCILLLVLLLPASSPLQGLHAVAVAADGAAVLPCTAADAAAACVLTVAAAQAVERVHCCRASCTEPQ
jgi:hypothetical protein